MCFLCFYPLLYLPLVISAFPFLYQTWLERSVFYYCLLLMPPQASTGISGDADVNCEVYVKIHQNIPKMIPTFYSSQNYFPFYFFCAITAPIPSLTLPFPPTNCSPSAVVSHWVFLLQLLGLLRCQDIFNITKDKSFPVVSYTAK